MLLSSQTERQNWRGDEEKVEERMGQIGDGEMSGKENRGRSQPHIAESRPPWTDRQTDTQECCTYNHLWRESGGSRM